jgi:hypothetical protein
MECNDQGRVVFGPDYEARVLLTQLGARQR